MLTRSGVAKKLGKSIATVRRLEGRELFPVVDSKGIHRFPDDQVQKLKLKICSGDCIPGARGDWIAQGQFARTRCHSPQHSTARLLDLETIDHERSKARREVAVTILELLDPRQLRRLGSELTGYLESLLDDDA